MATQRKRVTLASGDEREIDTDLVMVDTQHEDDPEESVDRIATLLDIAGNDAGTTLRVFKIQGGESQFCKTYSPHEFEDGNFDMLREQWGAGKFRLMLYGNNSSGKMVIRQRLDITLIAPTTPLKPAINPIVGGANDAVLQALVEGQQRIAQALLNRPQENPMDQMKNMLTMMTLMREAMGLNNTQSQKSTIGEIVDAIKELQGAKDIIGGDHDKPASLIGMGTKLIESLPGLMAGMRGQSGAPATVASPGAQMPMVRLPPSLAAENPAAGDPDATVNTNEPPNEDEEMNLLAMASLQGQLAKLTIMAKTNRDIEDAAEFIAAELPEELIPVLRDEGWFEALTQFAPSLRAHQTWLTAVRERALVIIAEDENEDAPEGGATQTGAPAPTSAPKL